MTEPKRKLTILVPELPWERTEVTWPEGKTFEEASGRGEAELRTWEEARQRAHINAALRQADQR